MAEVLHAIAGNIGDICRSELRLARAELGERASEARRPAATVAAGLVLAVHAVGLMLLALVYAAGTVVAPWAAALLVGAGTAVVAATLIALGGRGLRRVQAAPAMTLSRVRGDHRWAKEPSR